jgi:hypothetical protein
LDHDLYSFLRLAEHIFKIDQYLINAKYEISLASAFAFRCLSSLRSVGHILASCPAPNANVHFTFKRDLV